MNSKWKTCTLGDVLTLQRGHDLPVNERAEGMYPVVASTGIVGHHNVAAVKGPGVVIGRSGSIGGGQYIEGDFWPLNTTLWVKDFKGNNRKFCFYLLRSIDFSGMNVGSGVPTLNRNHVHPMEVLIPDLDIQERIAKFLSNLDASIQNLQQQNTTLEALAQTLFRSWFVNFDPVHAKVTGQTPEGMSPELAALFPSEFVESELGMIPKGFSFIPIKSLMGVEYGKNLPTKQLTDSGYPVFGGNGQIGYFSKFLFEDKRVVIACRGAASGKINFTKPFSYVTNNSLILSPDATKGWSFEFTKYTMLNQDLLDYVTGSAQPQLTIESLSALKLLSPPKELTTLFSKIINPLENAFDNNQELINCLGSLRDELLPRLISGKLRIEEAEEAVAEVLGSTAEEEKAA